MRWKCNGHEFLVYKYPLGAYACSVFYASLSITSRRMVSKSTGHGKHDRLRTEEKFFIETDNVLNISVTRRRDIKITGFILILTPPGIVSKTEREYAQLNRAIMISYYLPTLHVLLRGDSVVYWIANDDFRIPTKFYVIRHECFDWRSVLISRYFFNKTVCDARFAM